MRSQAQTGTTLRYGERLAMAADLSDRWREAYNNSAFWEVVHSHGERIFDSQREILQGTVMETVDRHGHDINHEVTEKVETLERLLSARKLEHLENVVKRERRWSGVSNHTSTNSQVESCTSVWKRLMCAGT